jgi:hypothetical protein
MKEYKWKIIIPVIFSLIAVGCTFKTENVLKPDYEKNTAKIIAVLPVDNKTTETKAPQMLRSKVLEELYFKGYTKLPLELIDKKLEPLYSSDAKGGTGVIAPQVVKELVGADAVMYCTLMEGKHPVSLFYAPVTISARCELRSTQTGEIIWHANYKETSRNFDITRKRTEMKSYEAFERVIEDVVNKVMETLPDGPNLRG